VPHLALSYLKRKGVVNSDVGVWLESMDGTVRRQLCGEKSFAYSWPQLAPDQQKILVANILGPDYGLLVLNLQCEVLAHLGGGVEDSIELAPGVYGWIGGGGSTARWSPDSRYVLDVACAENEFTIEAADLFLLKADGSRRVRLTNTPEVIEGSYAWSPDGSRIAFVAGTNQTIYVVKVR
jgi:hypothetical protein